VEDANESDEGLSENNGGEVQREMVVRRKHERIASQPHERRSEKTRFISQNLRRSQKTGDTKP
jgi:hypothetical protein